MDCSALASWKFSSAVPRDRAAKLLSWQSFDDIVQQLSTCQITPMWWEPAIAPRLKEKGCNRASFELTVVPDTYDAFFNAPVGYRGQFARSEAHGDAANRQLLEALFLRLLEVAAKDPTANLKFVTASLRGKQAKIWIDETEVEEQLSDPNPSIDFPAWDFYERGGQGLRAPRGTRLQVKGGWVSATGEEVLNTPKNQRSGNITRTGDTR
jgi:hypothetical protein